MKVMCFNEAGCDYCMHGKPHEPMKACEMTCRVHEEGNCVPLVLHSIYMFYHKVYIGE